VKLQGHNMLCPKPQGSHRERNASSKVDIIVARSSADLRVLKTLAMIFLR
jgi:hypothetical protein